MPRQGKQLVIVLNNDEHIIGLVIEKIIEIVNQNIEDNSNSISTLVLDGKATDIIDVSNYFDKLFFAPNEPINSANSQYKILLVEDSPYFRKLFSSLLESEGFNVVPAKNGQDASNLIKQQNFNLIIADYGMSDIDNNLKIPMIYLISNIDLSEEDKKTELHFVSKSSHSELIEVIDSLLKGV